MGIDKGKYYFTEMHKKDVGIIFEVQKTLVDTKSRFQNIKIFKNPTYGKVFTLDNMIMLTLKDEFCYHEMLVHIPLYTHPRPQNILIIGGGDGGTATEVLRHKSVKKVDLVEIDAKVVEVSKEHLPECCPGYKDKRVNIIIGDGIKYVKTTRKKYDVILVDSTDPIGPAIGLYKKSFYRNCKKALNNDGILCTLSLSPFLDPDIVRMAYKNVKSVFKQTFLYWGVVPTYPGAFWSYTLGTKKYQPLTDFQLKRYKKERLKTKYYNDQVHKAAFTLPNFMRDAIK